MYQIKCLFIIKAARATHLAEKTVAFLGKVSKRQTMEPQRQTMEPQRQIMEPQRQNLASPPRPLSPQARPSSPTQFPQYTRPSSPQARPSSPTQFPQYTRPSSPQYTQGHPQQIQGHPQHQGYPQQIQGHPQQIQGHPQHQGYPQQIQGHPQQIQGHPQQIQGHPQQQIIYAQNAPQARQPRPTPAKMHPQAFQQKYTEIENKRNELKKIIEIYDIVMNKTIDILNAKHNDPYITKLKKAVKETIDKNSNGRGMDDRYKRRVLKEWSQNATLKGIMQNIIRQNNFQKQIAEADEIMNDEIMHDLDLKKEALLDGQFHRDLEGWLNAIGVKIEPEIHVQMAYEVPPSKDPWKKNPNQMTEEDLIDFATYLMNIIVSNVETPPYEMNMNIKNQSMNIINQTLKLMPIGKKIHYIDVMRILNNWSKDQFISNVIHTTIDDNKWHAHMEVIKAKIKHWQKTQTQR